MRFKLPLAGLLILGLGLSGCALTVGSRVIEGKDAGQMRVCLPCITVPFIFDECDEFGIGLGYWDGKFPFFAYDDRCQGNHK